MRVNAILVVVISVLMAAQVCAASAPVTKRISQFSNDKVFVWKTVIYPGEQQTLKMHRHEHDRVLVALDNGLLKITNDRGKVHYLKLERDKAYYLTKDISGEFHNDRNLSSHSIRVLVVELKK